jgi:hypothetical protein
MLTPRVTYIGPAHSIRPSAPFEPPAGGVTAAAEAQKTLAPAARRLAGRL